MTSLSTLGWLATAALLAACSSRGPAGSEDDAGTPLFGVCSAVAAPPEATLGMSVGGVFGFTLPVPAGQTQDVTLTVLNSGSLAATQMVDLTPQTATLSYKGGTYPGTGGTCGDTLEAGASCTVVITLVAPMTGRQTSLVVIQYYDGAVYTTDAHQVEAVATTGAFATAPHAPLAPMPQNGGQAPLGNVSFVTVSFSDTPEDSAIQTFGDWLVGSGYWLAVGKDYGVGAGTHQHVQLDDPTPDAIIDHDFASYVDEKIASGALPPDSQSVYAFFLSSATTTTDVAGAGGWHNRTAKGHDYAVILPGCSSDPAAILDSYTFVASHELIEAATDPTPLSGYDFGFGEGEVADLCDGPTTQNGYSLPTIWSNTAAGQGGDPCVPASGFPYVDVDPSPPQVSIPSQAGASVSVTLTGWSTALVGDWLVQVAVAGKAASSLTATLDPSATDLLNNGESVQLTVTADGSAATGSSAIVVVTLLRAVGRERDAGGAAHPGDVRRAVSARARLIRRRTAASERRATHFCSCAPGQVIRQSCHCWSQLRPRRHVFSTVMH